MGHVYKLKDGHCMIMHRLSVAIFLFNALACVMMLVFLFMFIVLTDCDTISHYNQVSPEGWMRFTTTCVPRHISVCRPAE